MHHAMGASTIAQGLFSTGVQMAHLHGFLAILYRLAMAIEGGSTLTGYHGLSDDLERLGALCPSAAAVSLAPLELEPCGPSGRLGRLYVLQGAHHAAKVIGDHIAVNLENLPTLNYFAESQVAAERWDTLVDELEALEGDDITQAIAGVDSCFSSVYAALMEAEAKLGPSGLP